jgi:hypothetical protein
MLRRTGPEVGRGVHPSAREASSLTAKVALGPSNAEESTETKRNARAKAKLRCNVMFAEYMVARIVKRVEDREEYRKPKEVGTKSIYGSNATLISVYPPRHGFGWAEVVSRWGRVEVKLLSDISRRSHSQATQLSRCMYPRSWMARLSREMERLSANYFVAYHALHVRAWQLPLAEKGALHLNQVLHIPAAVPMSDGFEAAECVRNPTDTITGSTLRVMQP